MVESDGMRGRDAAAVAIGMRALTRGLKRREIYKKDEARERDVKAEGWAGGGSLTEEKDQQ